MMSNKKAYVSNKTIVILLSVAILLTLSGTILSVSKLLDLNNGYEMLTGAATDTATGQANVTITTTTSITNRVDSVNFGSGYVDSSCTECVMDSNGQHNQTGACCIGFNNVSEGFFLENAGNVNLSVNYTCSGNCTAAEFIGGTSPAFEIRVMNSFTRNGSGHNDSLDSCWGWVDDGDESIFGGWNLSGNPEGTYVTIDSNQNATLCGNETAYPLSPYQANDAAVVDINVSIPEDAPASSVESSVTFTFTGSSE